MSGMDLTAAVEAAAGATWEQVHGLGSWSEDPFPPLAQMHRDAAVLAVTAAAPLIEAAVREQIAASVLEWGQQYIIATRSEPGGLHWTCDHDFPGASCDTCFTNAGHAAQVAARIARATR